MIKLVALYRNDLYFLTEKLYKNKTIVIPSAGLSTGLANLETHAPRINTKLMSMLYILERFSDDINSINKF